MQEALYQKRVTRWHRRFLADVRSLAQLRKLGVSMVQINVAEQQIVAGHSCPSPMQQQGRG
jgi:hypothetical protein